jgi:tRNA pseudouridine55 synthase
MDGLLVVDKPSGPTSHDVVARMRRALREKRIGHTGTLDPMATGILLLVVGKATRLAKFLSASDKSYDAVVRLGFATDTADAQGQPLGPVSDRAMPSRDAIDAALDAFRGTFMQQPPAFSAKKIDGQRSYRLAREARLKPSRYEAVGDSSCPPALPALPAPVSVTTHALEILAIEADTVTLRVHCSAGFYIRSLAHDLGERLGVGAHLSALRRTRNGDFGLDVAVELDAAERDPAAAVSAMQSLAGMLPRLTAVVLTAEGVDRVGHGQDVRPGDHLPATSSRSPVPSPFLRLLDHTGALIAIAEPAAAGLLHPSVVLV